MKVESDNQMDFNIYFESGQLQRTGSCRNNLVLFAKPGAVALEVTETVPQTSSLPGSENRCCAREIA